MKKKLLILVTPAILILALIAAPILAAALTPISNTLTATTTAVLEEGQVSMTWSTESESAGFTADSLDLGMVVGVPVTIWVNAVSNVDSTIDRVLYVVGSSQGDVYTIAYDTGTETGTLTYDAGYSGYTFGPPGGFPMTPEWDVTVTFTVTATEAGGNTVSVYAIQLPE